MKKRTIDVLCTGGTFDKVYGGGVGNFSFCAKSAVGPILARFGVKNVNVVNDQKGPMDSLEMDYSDHQRIADWCKNSQASACIVIHGTDTMRDTAAYISAKCLKKAVILTGALQPACVRDSDAEFNLGGALIAAQISKPGVFIVMNGKIFPWSECEKNRKTGRFEVRP